MQTKFRLVIWFMMTYGYSLAGPELPFIENKKQWDKSIDYAVRVQGGSLFLKPGQFTYRFIDQSRIQERHEQGHQGNIEIPLGNEHELIRGHIVQSSLINSNQNAKPTPFGKLDTYHNYFIGSDSSRWSGHVNLFEGVFYSSIYNGVDLKVYSIGQNLKYDFIVAPGYNTNQIAFQYKGANEIRFENGDLVVTTPLGSIIEKKPVSYQIINGETVWIKSEYERNGNQISFCFPEGYDPCYPLVIDPVLIFSTYSGSTADNWGSTATHGENGTLYSAGVTTATATLSFPVTPGSFQTTYGGGEFDIGILKYDSAGQKLLYATYLGGSQVESAHSLVMNPQKELIVMGTTNSADFPTSATAFDRSYNGGETQSFIGISYLNGSDIFVAKFSAAGNQLLGSTYLGGDKNDGASPLSSPVVKNYGDELRGDVVPTSDGGVIVSTVTSSVNFPVRNSFDLTFGGGQTDAVIIKLNSSLSEIVWSTFLGGAGEDVSHTIQVDKDENLFVGGGSNSLDFAMTPSAYQKNVAGNVDGWIAHIKKDGSALISSTFTGTSSFDQIYFVDLDRDDNVFIYGQTRGAFPITAGTYRNANSGQFLQKFNHSLTTLMVSTVFGSGRGVPDISPTAFLVNDCNNIYLTGWGGAINTTSTTFWQNSTSGMPVTSDAFQRTTSGSDFYFIVLSIDATELLYATYMGGTQSKTHVDGGTSRFDKSGVVYHAVCSGCQRLNTAGRSTSDFPTTPNAWSRVNRSQNCNNAAFKFDLAALRARIQTNSVTLKQPGLAKVCLPDKVVFQNKSTGGQIYYWTFGDGTSITKADTARITHQYLQPGRYTIKLRVVDTGTCIGKDSTSIAINVFKPLAAVDADKEMCFDAGVVLESSGGASYQWTTRDNSFTSSAPNPFVNPKEDTPYFITVTDANGCVKKDTVNVKVIPGIDLDFEFTKSTDCYSRPVVRVKNLTDPAEEVFFDFGDGTTSDLDEDRHTYDQDGTYAIRIVGRKESCIYDKKVDVPIYEIKVPNVFTPNSSPGFNDTFKIGYGKTLISSTSLKINLNVFNRWGNKVYENENYKDNWTGEGLAAGVYYYELEIEGEGTCKGWVQVIK